MSCGVIDLWMCLIINAFFVIHGAFMVHSWRNPCYYFLLFCCCCCCAGAGALLLLLLLLVRCCGCCCCAGAAAALLLCAFCAHSLRILCALSAHCLCAFSVHSLCVLCAFSVQWSEVCSYQSSGDSATFCNWSARAPFSMGGRVISGCVKSQQSRACC